MRDVYPSCEPTALLPYDHVTHDGFPPIIPPSHGHGKGCWRKKVLITSLVVLVVGILLKGATRAPWIAQARSVMTTVPVGRAAAGVY
jgi:hypothetical protein